MTEFLMQYGLFLAKAATVVVAVGAIALIIAVMARREDSSENKLSIVHLNERYDAVAQQLKRATMSKKAFKAHAKALKKSKKSESPPDSQNGRMFVLSFKGDIRATGVASLRKEVTAILSLAEPVDEVVLKLENAGGLVHEHGLAASQLARIRKRNIPLTIAVDKVAASGGYMMACLGSRILAAPFAVLGSIGVLAQLPNFNRLLDAHGIEFEQFKGGEHKRTVTVFGKNTAEDRAKFKEEIEDTHILFKDFVASQRPGMDMAAIATGEHWYGQRALELKLCDELTTSDDYLLEASQNRDLYEVKYERKKPLLSKLTASAKAGVDALIEHWWQRARESRYSS